VALAVAGGGFALAGTVPATAATSVGTATPTCTDTWVGGGAKVLWTVAQNWSTGHVPGPSDNVCMSMFAIVTAKTGRSAFTPCRSERR
jgi:hypothetical protein